MAITLQLPSGQQVTVEANTVLIGRDHSCKVILPDEDGIQSRHATIKRLANRWMIQSEGDWLLQVGSGVPGRKCWLNPDDVIWLTEAGPSIVFMPSVPSGIIAATPSGRSMTKEPFQEPTFQGISSLSSPPPLPAAPAPDLLPATHATVSSRFPIPATPRALGENMTLDWYYSIGAQRKGPVATEELMTLATTGQLQATDLVWKEGMAQWAEAQNVKGLFPTPTKNVQSPPPIPASAPAMPTIPLSIENAGNTAATMSLNSPAQAMTAAAAQGPPPLPPTSPCDVQAGPSTSTRPSRQFMSKAMDFVGALTLGVKATAQMAAKKAQQAKVTTVDLPHAYLALGREVYKERRHQNDFQEQFADLDALVGQITVLKQAKPAVQGQTLTEKAKSAAGNAKSAATVKALEFKVSGLIRQLGQTAHDRFKADSGSQELVQTVERLKGQISEIASEIVQIGQTYQQNLKKKKIGLVPVIIGGAVIAILGLWIVGAIVDGSSKKDAEGNSKQGEAHVENGATDTKIANYRSSGTNPPSPERQADTEKHLTGNPDMQNDGLGVLLTHGERKLFYKSPVTEAEANSFLGYIVEHGLFKGSKDTLQLQKAGETYLFRFNTFHKQTIQKQDCIDLCRKISRLLSRDVFNGAQVDIHLCDEDMQTLRTLPADYKGDDWGSRLQEKEVLLFYKPPATEVEARALLAFLTQNLPKDNSSNIYQLRKAGTTYDVRWGGFTSEVIDQNRTALESTSAGLINLLSHEVFQEHRVELHLCDDRLNVLLAPAVAASDSRNTRSTLPGTEDYRNAPVAELSADFLPFKPGTELKYQTNRVTLLDDGDVALSQDYETDTQNDDGRIDSLTDKLELFDKNHNLVDSKSVEIRGDPTYCRITKTDVEIATKLEKEGGLWNPVLRLGARQGDVWTLSKGGNGVGLETRYTLAFLGSCQGHAVAAVVEEMRLKLVNGETGSRITKWYVKGLGLVKEEGSPTDGKVKWKRFLLKPHLPFTLEELSLEKLLPASSASSSSSQTGNGGAAQTAKSAQVEKQPESPTLATPDFPKVDYSIPEVDYTKGPNGENLITRSGDFSEDQNHLDIWEGRADLGNTTVQGYLDRKNQFVSHGLTTVWFEKPKQGSTGRKMREFYQYEGKQHGIDREWFANGKLNYEQSFKNGICHGPLKQWYDNGKPRFEGFYIDGKKHGQSIAWGESGAKTVKTYEHGALDGPFEFCSPDGAQVVAGRYINGKVVPGNAILSRNDFQNFLSDMRQYSPYGRGRIDAESFFAKVGLPITNTAADVSYIRNWGFRLKNGMVVLEVQGGAGDAESPINVGWFAVLDMQWL